MRTSWRCVLVWGLLGSATAAAQHQVGNGGDAVVCRSDAVIISAELLDFYESRVLAREVAGRPLTVAMGGLNLSPEEKVQKVLDRLARLDPFKAAQYREKAREFFHTAKGLDVRLAPINDEGLTIDPECPVEQLARQGNPEIPSDSFYYFDNNLWRHLNNDHRAGLVLHEISFGEALKMGHLNSFRSRFFTSFISSDVLDYIDADQYYALLGQIGFDFSAQESFRIERSNTLDLLVVVDNSASMAEHQLGLPSKMQNLMRDLSSHSDWQLGVVTTDDSCIRKGLITKNDYVTDPAHAQMKFRDALEVGTQGSNIERGIFTAAEGLAGNCSGQVESWVRPGASIGALIISDEDNCGSATNDGCPGMPGNSPEYFFDKAPAGSKVFGLLSNTFLCGGFNKLPLQYSDLIHRTGGVSVPICTEDYEPFLERMVRNLTENSLLSFQLRYPPRLSTVIFMIDGQNISLKYRIEGKTLIITGGIPEGATELKVIYRPETAWSSGG